MMWLAVVFFAGLVALPLNAWLLPPWSVRVAVIAAAVLLAQAAIPRR